MQVVGQTRDPTAAGLSIGLKKATYKITPVQNGEIGELTRDAQKLLLQTYDRAGRLTSVAGSFSGQTNIAAFGFDNFYRRNLISHGSGVAGAISYDNQDRISQMSWSGSPSYSAIIDRNRFGQVTQVIRENSTFIYEYSSRNELVSATFSGGSLGASLPSNYAIQTMSYGKSGSRISHAGKTYSSYDNYVYMQSGAPNVTFIPSSDGLGRMKVKTDGTYVFDFSYYPNGQIKRLNYFDSSGKLQKVVNYYYDGLGRRIAKVMQIVGQTSSQKVLYSHLGMENRILTARIVSGTVNKETMYVDGPGIDDHLFEISDSTGIKLYRTDYIGSVLNSAANGGLAYYPPFGENVGTQMSMNDFTEPVTYGFTGREYDPESKQYYYRARNYDPQTGAFTSKDPVTPRDGGDPNQYRYVRNNPLNFVDPMGLKLWYANSQAQTDLSPAVQTMMQSAAGRQLLSQLHNSDNIYYIHNTAAPNGSPAAAVVGGRHAWVMPNFHPTIGTDAGPQSSSTARVLAHELGHLTGVGDTPDPGNRMDNVNRWENSIMQPIEGYSRTMYGDPNASSGHYGGSSCH